MNLSNEQIDALAAGPELDALLEAHIFARVPCEDWIEKPTGWLQSCDHEKCYPAGHPFPYSSEIFNAWMVVMLLAEQARYYELVYRPTGALANFVGDPKFGALATFDETKGDRTKAQCLAIGRAALKAVPFFRVTTEESIGKA